MEKTYSQLLVIIARRDLELARIREKIERENREYNEVYREALEAHKRVLQTVATEYQNSLAELSEKVEYWMESTATARKERDKLYGEVAQWQEEYKTALNIREKAIESFKGLETDFIAMRIQRNNLEEELKAYKRCNKENCETIDRLRIERDNLATAKLDLQTELDKLRESYKVLQSDFEIYVARDSSPETSPETSPESCPMLEFLNSEENPFN